MQRCTRHAYAAPCIYGDAAHWLLYDTCSALLPIAASYAYPYEARCCRGQVFGLLYVMRYLVCAHQHSPLCHTNIVVYGTAR